MSTGGRQLGEECVEQCKLGRYVRSGTSGDDFVMATPLMGVPRGNMN